MALRTIACGLVEVGGGVDVDVAVAGGGVDDRHGGDGLQRLLQALAAARDDQIDGVALRGELGELLASAAGHEADAALGQPGGDGGLAGDLREHGVGVRRRSRSPRRTIALPDFRHSAAASIVTFGRAS